MSQCTLIKYDYTISNLPYVQQKTKFDADLANVWISIKQPYTPTMKRYLLKDVELALDEVIWMTLIIFSVLVFGFGGIYSYKVVKTIINHNAGL